MRARPLLALSGLWAAGLLIALWVRPLWPVDETRYLAVAWEMWQRGDFLVPYLNGAPYSHKPPLLFWLMHLGWSLFGVNEWWPRLVPPLFALANLFLIARLACRLWPERADIAVLAPWIAFGGLLWTVFSTVVLFDMLMVFFALTGMLGLVEAWRGNALRGWALLAVAIGLGVLAKGPVILLHTLPAALLAPWWAQGRTGEPRSRWRHWYGGVLAAILIGALIALSWALAAGQAGGPAYRDAIFWGQTADRMSESFAHRQPWWWYAALLPLILFPWLFWPPLWRAWVRLRAQPADPGVRFVLAWLVPVFVAFSLISGKQPQYLLPLFAALALLLARALSAHAIPARRRDLGIPGGVIVLLGAILVFLPHVSASRLPEWAAGLSFLTGLLVALGGLALAVPRAPDIPRQVQRLAVASAVLLAVAHLGTVRAAAPAHDLAPLGAYLQRLQQDGRALAHLGKYHGQYQFVGRLRAPLAVVVGPAQLKDWAARHPGGKVVAYSDALPPGVVAAPDYEQPFRAGRAAVWDGARLAEILEERGP